MDNYFINPIRGIYFIKDRDTVYKIHCFVDFTHIYL